MLLNEVAAAENPSQEAARGDEDSSADEDAAERREQALATQQFTKLVRDELQKHVEQESAVRGKLLEEIEDTKRIDSQRVYREQLAEQGAKRKERRRKKREQANLQAYMAKIERKRLEQAFPLAALEKVKDPEDALPPIRSGDSSSGSTSDPGRSRQNQSAVVASAVPELLAWEKAVPLQGAGVRRPKWVPREGWTHQTAASRNHDASMVLLEQCQQIYCSLQHAKQRSPKRVHSIPDPVDLLESPTHPRTSHVRRAAARPETAP